MSTTSSSPNEVVRRALYLAGAFDSGLAAQVVKPSRENNRYAVRISKTSRNSGVPAMLYEQSGYLGKLFQTAHGTRWAIENERDMRKFFELIEPYIKIRKQELGLLWRINDWQTPIEEQAMLYREYQTLRNIERAGTPSGREHR